MAVSFAMEIPRCARDFGCGLTPAKRLNIKYRPHVNNVGPFPFALLFRCHPERSEAQPRDLRLSSRAQARRTNRILVEAFAIVILSAGGASPPESKDL